jgi:hypothetical protein
LNQNNFKALIFLITSLFPFLFEGQVRTITGRVIDGNDLTPMPEVKIQNSDTTKLGMTDRNGNFQIELPNGTTELVLIFIGMERTSIKVPADCSNLEIIMMPDVIYDFITINKENRKRYRRFKDLSNKHRQAHEKGVFASHAPCFAYVFSKH